MRRTRSPGACRSDWVRAARRSPAASLDAVAAAAGVDHREICDALGSLKPRGGCGRAVAALARSSDDGRSLAGLAHRACPPPMSRLAADRRDGMSPVRALALRGPARWATRPSLETASGDERRMLAHHLGCPPRLIPLLAQDNS